MDNRLREEIIHMHAQICSGLADPNRILIIYALQAQPSNVSDLAETLGASQPTVSRHLKILRDLNMVSARREGQSVVYSLADPRIVEALDLLRAVMTCTLANKAELVRAVESIE